MSDTLNWPAIDEVLCGNVEYHVEHGDTIRYLGTLPEGCVSHAIFSPPFPAVFAYQSDVADIGNSEEVPDLKLNFLFFFRALIRVMQPGRVVMCHCMQIPRQKRSGGIGMFNFRDTLIALAERAGFVYEYDWMVRKNPQAQALRTHPYELQFACLENDRVKSRGCLCDYLIKLQVPGNNEIPVDSPQQVSRVEWTEWAEGYWDIPETDTLNVQEARSPEDVRHICPLALGIYERSIRLYTNPGEVVLDPFAGIGSCGFVAMGGASPKTGRHLNNTRRFIGVELKPEYHAVALKNCDRAIRQRASRSKTLFDGLEDGTNG